MTRFLLFVVFTGCATNPSAPLPTTTTSEPSAEQPLLTYDIEEARSRAKSGLFYWDLTRDTSFVDSVEIQQITGDAALQIFEQDQQTPPEQVRQLLEIDGSIALIASLEGAALPQAILFIPPPKTPKKFAHGFMYLVGVKPLEPRPGCEACPPIDFPPFSNLADQGVQVVVAVSESCGNTPSLERALSGIGEIRDDPRVFTIDAFSEENTKFLKQFVRPSVPSLLIFRDGKFVDYAQTSDERAIRHLLFRNGFGVPDPGLETRWKTEFGHTDLLRTVSALAMNSADLARLDLRGGFFQRNVYSGSDFSESDLRGANFNRAHLQHVNFTGANLEGATFEGAIFEQTICPDGKVGECG